MSSSNRTARGKVSKNEYTSKKNPLESPGDNQSVSIPEPMLLLRRSARAKNPPKPLSANAHPKMTATAKHSSSRTLPSMAKLGKRKSKPAKQLKEPGTSIAKG